MNTADVAAILREIDDPELGIDVVSLGLIFGIAVDDERVKIEMTVTTPLCPMEDTIAAMVGNKLAAAAGGRSVFVEMVEGPEWEIGMAEASALRRLGLRRD